VRRVEALRELARRAHAELDMSKRTALIAQLKPLVDALDTETRGAVFLADGETAELVPGVPDDDISTVERLRAVCQYVRDRVRGAIAAHVAAAANEPMRVVVEYQNINPKTRPVAAALIAIFSEEDVFMVGPALKNKVAVCEAGRYCFFTERYSNTYRANKEHASFNFRKVEQAYGTCIPSTSPPSLRGHIADSFMQVLGYILYGPEKGADKLF